MSEKSLPGGWAHAVLDAVTEISPGVALDGLTDKDEVHFVPMAAAAEDFAGIDVGQRRPLGSVRKGYTAFAEGDVLLAKITPCMENGKGGLVPKLAQRVAFGSTEFHVLRPSAAVTSGWLAHFLSQPVFRKLARANMTGTAGQMRVPTKWLRSVQMSVPPVAEQARIVTKLEELLSDLDAGVAELKAAQRKLVQYRQSLLKAAVEGTLTTAWRAARAASGAATETGAQLLARILQERRARWEARQRERFAAQGKAPPKDWQKKYPEPVAPDTAGLPELPQGWVWASGEQLCDFITKGTTPPKGLDAGGDRSVPFLRVTNLTDKGVLDLSDEVFVSEATHQGFLSRSVVYPGDVLMNIVGPPLGQVAVVADKHAEWNINQAIAIFRAVAGVLPDYLCCYLLSSPAQRWLKARAKTTAGQTNLTLEVCRALPFPLPPQDEQRALVNLNEQVQESVRAQGVAIVHGLAQSTAQRQNILRAAFSGQLVPQDPAEEPANALLARIRAERTPSGANAKPRRGRAAQEAS